jgi:flagellar biosynthesis/type III secretory pathway protein FliH
MQQEDMDKLVKEALGTALSDYLATRKTFDEEFISAIETRCSQMVRQVVAQELVAHEARIRTMVYDAVRERLRHMGSAIASHY